MENFRQFESKIVITTVSVHTIPLIFLLSPFFGRRGADDEPGGKIPTFHNQPPPKKKNNESAIKDRNGHIRNKLDAKLNKV